MKIAYKVLPVFLLLAVLCNYDALAGTYLLRSPDRKLSVKVVINDSITYSISFNNTEVIKPSVIAMRLDKQVLGYLSDLKKGKASESKEYNELVFVSPDHYSVIFRAYNEGIAYRFVTDLKDSVKVLSERAEFNVKGDAGAVLAETENYTSWELPYVEYSSVASVNEGKRAVTPALFTYKNTGIKVVLAESDVFDYPGMYIKKDKDKIIGNWAAYPTKTVMGSWGNFVSVVKERADFIATTSGKRAYPWRVVIATDDDKRLLTDRLIYKLARPSRIRDISWIKPGKSAWEWWHDAMLPGADIPSGMDNRNTALYNYYVDFAARNKLEYMMIDAGWSNVYNLPAVNPKVDIREVIQHASSKKVGVFLWCVAATLLKDLNANLDFIRDLGAAGIKVDFFDRDDQEAIAWMEKIAEAAAERKLMVDFHGCTKPTGLEKTYPNIVNYEAVRGAECSKWDYTANPRHHMFVSFIRMLAGPIDYTPGSMRNKQKDSFKPVDPGLPSTLGTRCHELAMYVIFDQPLAMLCDSPVEYEKYPDIMNYLSAVPTVFDETKVLSAKFGEYAAIAKRKQNEWFIGAMTNWDPRDLEIDFSFLPAGKEYSAEVYSDGREADRDAEKYDHKKMKVNSTTKMNLHAAPGGGAVIYLHP